MNWLRSILVLVCITAISAPKGWAEFETEEEGELPLLQPKKTSPPSKLKEEDEEEEPPLLRPRKASDKPQDRETIPLLRPKRAEEAPPSPPLSVWQISSIGLWLQTPLVNQSGFERRFSTFGLGGLVSFPVWRMSDTTFGAVQTGLTFNLTRLTLSQPALSFASLIIDIPVLFQVIFALDRQNQWGAELFGGGVLRALEYDSRPTTDGGLGFVRSSTQVLPDLGAGLFYRASQGLVLRLRASYLLLSAGLEFPL